MRHLESVWQSCLSCDAKRNGRSYGKIVMLSIMALSLIPSALGICANRVSVLRVDDRKPILLIDGKPTPLFFARGLTSIEELTAYREAGFNCIWVDLAYGQDALAKLASSERLLEAAEKEGLFAIVSIDATPPKGMLMSIYDARYISFLRSWLAQVVKSLSKHENVVAWATTNFADERMAEHGGYGDEGFRAYLADTYGDAKALSFAFGIPIVNLSTLTQQIAMTADDLQSPTHYGHASISGALYRWCSLRWLLWLWGKVIRDADPTRPIFTGLLSTYRSIASVPSIYDGVITATLPLACEPDFEFHNAHAISIGRRSNTSIVIPVMASQSGSRKISLTELIRWVQLAAFGGASGVGFNSWQPFKSNENLREALSELLAQLSEAEIWHATPLAHAAILYIPFAEGFVQDGMPLYGYATPHGYMDAQPQRLILGEPNGLFYAFKLGSRYGQLDYITIESLVSVNPYRYSLILMPSPIFISPHVVGQGGEVLYGLGMPKAPAHLSQDGLREEAFLSLPQWLANFVLNGGVLISDIGASLSPAGEPFRLMPVEFAKLFGVAGARMLIVEPNLELGMSILFRHPLFPSLNEGYMLGDGEMPFRAIAAVLRFIGAQPYALMMRSPRRTRKITSEAVAMCINQFGRGFSVYAPTLLWANWNSASESFEAFHSDLLRRGAMVELLSSPRLIDSDVNVALFDSGIALMNNSGITRLASIRVSADAAGGISLANACVEFPVGSRSEHFIVQRFLQPLELALTKWLPIAVDCGDRFVALVHKYDANGISFTLYGRDAVISAEDGRLRVRATKPVSFKVSISSGEYEIVPNSKHIVTLSTTGLKGDGQKVWNIVADDDGKLKLEVYGASARIEVQRAGWNG